MDNKDEKSIGQRLRQERKRLNLTQAKCGEIGGVTRESQRNYEIDKRSPNNVYWQAVAKVGVDIQYVITGKDSLNLSEVILHLMSEDNPEDTDISTDILQVIDQIRTITEKHQTHIDTLEEKLKKFQADINNGLLDDI